MKWNHLFLSVGMLVAAVVTQNSYSATDHFLTSVVEFKKGHAEVTADMKKEIQKLVSRAKSNEPIDEVIVAAWADEARVGDNSLTDAQEDLAAKRAKNLRVYLEDALKVDVDTFNMAKKTSLWSRVFDTEEARAKGRTPTGFDTIARRIHEHGKPGAAVLVVEPKNKPVSE